MLFDTHCHLNFQAFAGKVEEVIKRAKKAGVDNIVIPGTDLETSKKAVEIASSVILSEGAEGDRVEGSGIYAAVGIHPHHVTQYVIPSEARDLATPSTTLRAGSGSVNKRNYASLDSSPAKRGQNDIGAIEKLLSHPKVVAVGEVGIDKHEYKKTVYQDYQVPQEFIELQKQIFIEQIKLAHQYNKALIIHNREAKKDVLEILTAHSSLLTFNCVFHCCEPDEELLDFAKKHKIFIGVDGDVVYREDKQEFIKKVPLEMLVLETDSPFLAPDQKFPNEPKNIKIIAEFIAELKNTSIKHLIKVTTENAKRLFKI